MGIRPLLEWFLSIWTLVFAKRVRSGTPKSDVSSSTPGLESEQHINWAKPKSDKPTSVRFLTFVSQSIFFETGGDKSGAYTNDPDDKGGETKWGISKAAHPHLNIKSLTYNQAVEIYRTQYWNDYYDYILNDSLAFKLFDIGILSGRKTAVRLLQAAIRSCGLLVREDGVFGPMSLTAVNNIKPEILYEKYIELNTTRLKQLVVRVQTNKKYLIGWLNRVHWKWSTE